MSAEEFAEICPLAEKAVKMYEAVRILLEEGADINTLKVSQITQKAGIGKGTAYEYFKSKEEMVAKAILYGMMKNLQEIQARVESCASFREKYMTVADWMKEIFEGNGSLMIFCRIAQDSMQITHQLKVELDSYISGPEYIFQSILKLIREEQEKGTLKSLLPENLQASMVLSSFGTFWIYIHQNPTCSEQEWADLKEFLYGCLMQNLTVKR